MRSWRVRSWRVGMRGIEGGCACWGVLYLRERERERYHTACDML